MSKFVRKGDEVEAEQWQPGRHVEGVFNEHRACKCPCNCGAQVRAEMAGAEGPVLVYPGDWIITGAFGARYNLSDNVFRAGHVEVAAE